MTQYLTGVGGYASGQGGTGSYYRGPQGSFLGTPAGFTASVMLSGYAQSLSVTPQTLFGARRTGPDTGWEIQITANPGGFGIGLPLVVLAEVAVTSGVVTTGGAPLGLGLDKPYAIATMTVDPNRDTDGEITIFVNGHSVFTSGAFQQGDVYLPPPPDTRAALGARDLDSSPDQFASSALLMGAAYQDSVLTDAEIYRHQVACLQAGDMVDGNRGSGFSSGVPVFEHLYSARRSNNGIGVTDVVNGTIDGVGIGQVPRAATTWPDERGAIDFSRVDGGDIESCFVSGVKRFG